MRKDLARQAASALMSSCSQRPGTEVCRLSILGLRLNMAQKRHITWSLGPKSRKMWVGLITAMVLGSTRLFWVVRPLKGARNARVARFYLSFRFAWLGRCIADVYTCKNMNDRVCRCMYLYKCICIYIHIHVQDWPPGDYTQGFGQAIAPR